MATTTIPELIINSPYEEPREHWKYDPQTRTFSREIGRRPAGYVKARPESHSFDDPGIFVELPLVNKIRPRVKAWREAGYPGVTGITKRLLEHWYEPPAREDRRLFFCQLESVETLIWLTEAPPAERQGIDVPERWRSFHPALFQNGNGEREDDFDGHADCVASSEQGDLPAGQAILQECLCGCARIDRQEQASGAHARRAWQFL